MPPGLDPVGSGNAPVEEVARWARRLGTEEETSGTEDTKPRTRTPGGLKRRLQWDPLHVGCGRDVGASP